MIEICPQQPSHHIIEDVCIFICGGISQDDSWPHEILNSACSYNIEHKVWSDKSNIPLIDPWGIFESGSFAHGGVSFVYGGPQERSFIPSFAHHHISDAWNVVTEPPTLEVDPYGWRGCTANGNGYLIGGFDSDKYQNSEYNIGTEAWVGKEPLGPTSGRYFHCQEPCNSMIYILGGSDLFSELNLTDEYNVFLDTWAEKACSPYTFRNASSFVINEDIYSIGDCDTNFFSVSSYGVLTDTWMIKSDSHMSACNFGGASYDENGYVIGIDHHLNSETNKYFPVLDIWTNENRKYSHPRTSFSITLNTGSI